jgi:sulfate adenylyltransferase large subunit
MSAALQHTPAALPIWQDNAAAPRMPDLLRFITCGSVDDGKSTLIGRLLHDAGQIPEDQLAALGKDSQKFGTQGEALDFALLVDGLAAEREQGITIDVAYRYFATARRSFIVADTPGHEQYTRNMATGASTADVAIILIDASKGVLPQTRRHSAIVSMLGVRHVVLAVNKMDLVGHDRGVFDRIVADYLAVAQTLGFKDVAAIPLAARNGDNVLHRSVHMPWYQGVTLLEYLESVDTVSSLTLPFRFPVQWVNRPSADFRGFAGWVSSGEARVGDEVRILPSGRTSRIARIVSGDGDRQSARHGEAMTLTLTDEVDVSRGDFIVALGDIAKPRQQLPAKLLWMSAEPMVAGREYILKLAASETNARVTSVAHTIDISTLKPQGATTLEMNGIATVELLLDRPLVALDYAADRELGAFILIDKLSFETVALGLVQAATDELAEVGDKPTGRVKLWLNGGGEQPKRSLVKAITWRITGTADTFVLSYLFTSSAKVAAAISLSEVATKLVLYYGHERIWARLRYGLQSAKATLSTSTHGGGI